MAMNEPIKTIQLKRGTKADLEAMLVTDKLGVLLAGEPAYETDTKRIRIGDGVSAYSALPYIMGEDPRLNINNPKEGQILSYDSAGTKWVNKDTLFKYTTTESVAGKQFLAVWKVMPTSTNTVFGIATNLADGSVYDIVSTNGVISAAKIVSEFTTIGNADVGDEVTAVSGLSANAYNAEYNSSDACLKLTPVTVQQVTFNAATEAGN